MISKQTKRDPKISITNLPLSVFSMLFSQAQMLGFELFNFALTVVYFIGYKNSPFSHQIL